MTKLGVGIGLRSEHYDHILENPNQVEWFEAISENYIGIKEGSGGPAYEILEKVRRDHEIVLHGVSMSIGSVDPVDFDYLRRLKTLISKIQPAWVSDHLCWTGINGENLHDLLPLPYTEEALTHISQKILRVQDFLGRPVLFENPSSYLSFKHSEMTEWEFLAEMSRQTGCGILLDINNIYVSSVNQGFNPMTYLDSIPKDHVGQMHLAGYSQDGKIMIDTHDHPVSDPVWDLYRYAIIKMGRIPTLIEWDDQIPEFEVLKSEADKASLIQKEFSELPEVSHGSHAQALTP